MEFILILFILIIILKYVIMLFGDVNNQIRKFKRKYIVDFMISICILAIIFLVTIINEGIFYKYYLQGYIALTFSYCINIKLLFRLMNYQNMRLNTNIKIAFILIFIITINLFLGAYLATFQNPNAYTIKCDCFSLYYYTIISFVTIGYGDIIPATFLAKLMSIVIAYTSILCLIIFINCILRDK